MPGPLGFRQVVGQRLRTGGVPATDQARVEKIGRALSALGGGTVRVRRQGKRLVVSLRDVPIEQLAALGAPLQGSGPGVPTPTGRCRSPVRHP